MPKVAVVGWQQETNVELAAAWRALGIDAELLDPWTAARTLVDGDVAVGRIDVLPGLDGVQSGLTALDALQARGIRVVNSSTALLTAHDKLATEASLARLGLPRPRTWHVGAEVTGEDLDLPIVLKPRFGSWGRDVFRCRNDRELRQALWTIRNRAWFRRHGAIAQELLSGPGFDLRLLVARGELVGAARRVAKPGEWRTNVSLGGTLEPSGDVGEAAGLAIAAAASIGGELVGVDVIPLEDGFLVLELNGAVEFDERYALADGDVYALAACQLGLLPERGTASPPRPHASTRGAVITPSTKLRVGAGIVRSDGTPSVFSCSSDTPSPTGHRRRTGAAPQMRLSRESRLD